MSHLLSISPMRRKQVQACLVAFFFLAGKLVAQVPTISSISPTSASVNATVIITGTNFNTTPANNTVFFGPVKATVTFATGTVLSVKVPAGAAYGRINVLNTATGLSATGSQFFTPVFSPDKPGLIAADITVQGDIGGGTPGRLYSLGASDLDNDGKPDLVITSGALADNRVYIRKNTGTATAVAFASSITITVAGGLSRPDGQISFGDLNGDSQPDIVVPGADANAFAILRNNGSLSFTSSVVSTAESPTGSVISDFDLDGKPDIAISDYNSSVIIAYPNTTLTPASITVGSGITMTGSLFQTIQLVAADLDGDGKPEIIAPQNSSYMIHFYQNTSTPGSISFGTTQSLNVFSNSPIHNASFIAVGDLNNDGKPDMVVTDGNGTNANSIAILRNTSTVGSITFSITTLQIGATPYNQGSASFADMNGDGKPDLVIGLDKDFDISPGLEFRIAVLYNISVGDNISFSAPIEYFTGTTALGYSCIASDMNGDGIPDILAPGGNSGNISVYRGSPQFAPTISSISPLSAAPTSGSVVITGTGFNSTPTSNIVEFGTVTGTVTAASTTSLTVKVPPNASYGPITVLNRGNTLSATGLERFMPAIAPNKSTLAATDFVQQATFSVTGQLYGLAAGDLTGDGKPELVVSNSQSNSLIILPNISTIGGPVSFGSPTVFTPTANFDGPRYVSLADLDGNGWLDVVVPSFNLSTVGIFLNSGTGTLSTSFTLTGSFATGMGPIGVATGDLDGDGKPDIVTSNYLGAGVSVFRNTSTDINAVSFAAKQDYNVSGTDAVYNLALADIDNDGKLDIIAERDAGLSGKVVLLRNTSVVGSISFAPKVEIAGPNAPWTIVPGDLNGDGLTDFVVSAGGSSATEIFAYTKLSSGGALTNLGTTQLDVSQANVAIALADLNGDGKPDVISGTRDAVPGYRTYIYPNTTTGTTTSFGTRISLPGSYDPFNTVTTDLNADGRPDIVMGNQQTAQSTITVFRNTLIASPVIQASGITVTGLTGTTGTFSWTGGSGSKRALFIKATSTGAAAPITSTDYTANTVFGSGSQIGSTGWYCVYNGTGNLVNVTGFTPSASYRAMVTEFNDGGFSNTAQYNTSTATNNPVTFTARATVTAISITTASATINTNTADFRVTFNATMTGLATSNFGLAVTGITGASVTAVTGSGTVFTVTANTGSGDGTLGLNLVNTTGMVPDVTNTLAYPGEVYTIDKTAPTLSPVTIVSSNSNSSRAKTGNVITLGFTSSEAIGVPVVTLAGHTVAATTTGSNNWTVSYTMTGTDAEGPVAFTIAFSDVNGNAGTAVSVTTNSSSVVFDRTAPSLSPVAILSNNSNTSRAKQGNTVTLSFTASETISPPVVTIAGHTVTAGNSGNNWTASYTMTGADAEGTIAFSIACSDAAGNAGTTVTATTNSSSVVFDRTAPALSTVTIASGNSNTAYAKTGDVVTVNFTGTETLLSPVMTIATHAITPVNITANAWTASYTMTGTDAEGTVAFNIAFSDINGNTGTAVSAATNSSSVVFDRTAPSLSSVAISSGNSNTAYARAGNVVTVNFTGTETLLSPVMTIATHAITPVNITANAWTASYTMTGTDTEGNIPFSIAFTDRAGNAGISVTGATDNSKVVYDITAPALSSVTIASANSNMAKAKTGDLITLDFSSNETIASSVTIAGHAVTAVNTGGNNWTTSYTMTGTDAEGTIAFSIACSDAAGNAGTTVTATTNSSSVVFDRTAPALSSVAISSGNSNTAYAKTGDVVTVNFTGTETLLSPVMTIAAHAITPVNITANAWTASYTMTGTDAEGNISFSIVFTDLAGNAGISVTGTTDNGKVLYDITKPILSVVSIGSDNAISSVASLGNTVTISFTANEAVLTPTVTLAGHTISASNTGTNTWAAAYAMQLTDTEGTIVYSIVFRDMAGNTGTAVTAATNGSRVIFSLPPGPNFAGGAAQGLTICIDAGLTAINQFLRVIDNSNGAALTWSVVTPPAHGSVSGFNTNAVTNGGIITPAGLGYQSFAGYAGADAFTVRVSDGTFSATTTINVTVSSLPSGNITSTGGITLCAGSSLTLTASGGNTYKWFRDGVLITGNSTSQLSVTVPGIYTASIVNTAGCEAPASNSITIILIQQPKADFTPDANTCINLSLQFTNTSVITNSGTVSYLWNDGKGLSSTAVSPSFSYTQTGAYNVKLKVIPQACPALSDSITKTITTVQAVAGIRNPTMDVAKNQLTQLTVRGLPGATYQWSPARFLLLPNVASPTIIATAEQEYLISQRVPGGCVTVDTLLVRLHENTTAYLPNVFTPNGDGQNDILMPNLVGVKQLRFFRIFNRWGKMLFETTNIGVGWDGKYNGVLQPLDTYTWSIEGYDGNGIFVKRQGSVTLIR